VPAREEVPPTSSLRIRPLQQLAQAGGYLVLVVEKRNYSRYIVASYRFIVFGSGSVNSLGLIVLRMNKWGGKQENHCDGKQISLHEHSMPPINNRAAASHVPVAASRTVFS